MAQKPLLFNETGLAINETLKSMKYNERSIDADYASQIEAGKIDQLFEKWWAEANDGNYTKTELLSRWFTLLKDDKLYGVKTYNFEDSQTSEGVLLEDSVDLGVCVPATEASEGTDNFVKQPAFWIKEINYEIDSNGEIEVKAVQGVDDDFSRDGHSGMVGVAQKSAFYLEYNDATYNILKYSTTRLSGFKPLPECVSPVDNSIRPFMVHAKYMGGIGSDGKPTSATGLAPMNYSYSHNSQIAPWRTRGANYSGMSMLDLKFREFMFRLKYAKKGNSGTMEGCSSYYLSYRPAVAESNVTRVILTEANAANLVVGSWLSVGTAERNANNVLPRVRIKAIKDVTIDGTAYKAVYLDTTTAISPTTEWYVSTIPWGSGSCDNVKGVDGSPNLTNGKYPFIIQGLESQTGCWAVLADTIGVKTLTDNVMNIVAKMVRLARNIATSVTANYYDGGEFEFDSTAAGWKYIQDFEEGVDALIPRAIGGAAGSSNGAKCGFYDPHNAGTFEWLAWAGLDYGGRCGLGAVHAGYGLGDTSWHLAAGAPASAANRGEWTA